MVILITIVKGIALTIFTIVSAYVFLYGKSGTGIKADYAFTVIFLLLILLRL